MESGKPYPSDKIRAEIVKHFSEPDIPFTYLEFRHFFTGIARKHLPRDLLNTLMEVLSEFCILNSTAVHPVVGFIPQTPFETVKREPVPDTHDEPCKNWAGSFSRARVPDLLSFYPIHEQSGHTLATASKIYGIRSSDMNGLGKSKLEVFRLTLRGWQSAMRLSDSVEKRKEKSNLDDGPRKIAKVDDAVSAGTLKQSARFNLNANPKMPIVRVG